MPTEEKISIPKFAQLIGVSKQAVYKAVESGRIKKGIDSKRKITPSIAEAEFLGTSVRPRSPQATINKPKKNVSQKVSDIVKANETTMAEDSAVELQENGDLPTSTVSYQKKIAYEAKLKELEYNKKQGLLVEKSVVYKLLYAYGKEIRTALEALPDRHVDDIMAARLRNEGHSIFTKAVNEVLVMLTDVGEVLDKNL